ncbi:MAG: prepilin peptidase [Candidatus Jacksonbacteria bacterium]
MILFYIILFILGLSVGSFINATVYRLQNNKKIINDRSACPKCRHKLAWYDLIPGVSFFVLKGKCRYCRKRILWQYPLIEFLTGIIFILPIIKLPELVPILIYLLFACILMTVFAYDLRYMLIPDKISIPAILIVIIAQFFFSFEIFGLTFAFHYLLNLLLAGFAAASFFMLQFIISKGSWIGGGDIRLGFLMGLMLGWPNIIIGVFLAYIIGAAFSLPLVIIGKKSMKSPVPFGVFLTAAAIITLLWAKTMMQWYL